jgi:hypothetical protein
MKNKKLELRSVILTYVSTLANDKWGWSQIGVLSFCGNNSYNLQSIQGTSSKAIHVTQFQLHYSFHISSTYGTTQNQKVFCSIELWKPGVLLISTPKRASSTTSSARVSKGKYCAVLTPRCCAWTGGSEVKGTVVPYITCLFLPCAVWRVSRREHCWSLLLPVVYAGIWYNTVRQWACVCTAPDSFPLLYLYGRKPASWPA